MRKTASKEHIVRELEGYIKLIIKKAKAEHRRYLGSIQDGDFKRQCSLSSSREDFLETARMMKNAMLPYGRKIRPYGYLHKVQARRLERESEEAAKCEQPTT